MKDMNNLNFDNVDEVFTSLEKNMLVEVEGGAPGWLNYVNNLGYWINKISIDIGA